MTSVSSGYLNADKIGRATFEHMDDYTTSVLLAGAEPQLSEPMAVLLADSTTLAQFTVVALDNNGALVKATQTGNKAIGVLAHAATSGTGNATIRGQVWYTGCFNLNADSPLVWDTSFTTDAQKAAAFRGSPSPCMIIVRHRNTPAS